MKILNFHTLSGHNDAKWFESVLIYLKNKKQIISVEEFYLELGNNELKKDKFVITFDDGHKSFYDSAFPVLKKLNIPAVLFVSPEIISKKKNFWFQEIAGYNEKTLKEIISDIVSISLSDIINLDLNAVFKSLRIQDIEMVISRYQKTEKIDKKETQNIIFKNLIELRNSGLITIGAHTLNHPILSNEEDSLCENEIKGSIEQLSSDLYTPIRFFAYPNGIRDLDYSDREIEILESCGIDLAFSTMFRKISDNDNLLELPRGEISNKRMNFAMKIYLWQYWRRIVEIRNSSKEVNDRKKMRKLLINNLYY